MLIILLTNKLTEYKVSKTHFRTIFMCGDCTQETWAPLPSLCSNTCYVVLNTYLILTVCWEIPKQEKKTFWLQRCLLKNDRLKQVIIKRVIISCPKQPFLLSHEERFLSTSMISVKSVSKPVQWHAPTLGKLRQKKAEFKASVDTTVRPLNLNRKIRFSLIWYRRHHRYIFLRIS